jgi:hypothetical protein
MFQPRKLLAERAGKVDKETDLISHDELQQLLLENYVQTFLPSRTVHEDLW